MKNTLECFKNSKVETAKHSTYFAVYDELFAKFKGKEFTFVEVGVAHGGSLFMWREFFGDKARIIGIDINPGAKRWEKDGFEIFIGRQEDPSFWQSFYKQVGDIDILLDDGGHFFDQQIITLDSALDYVRDNGMIVIEDTHSSYLREWNGPRNFSFQNYALKLAYSLTKRFGQIAKYQWQSRNIFKICFHESITSFHINRKKSSAESYLISNHGEKMTQEYFGEHFAKDAAGISKPMAKKYGPIRKGLSQFVRLIKYKLKKRALPNELKKYFSNLD